MEKTVHLNITSLQRDCTGAETVMKTTATAEYFEKGSSYYILYEESLDETTATIKNIIKYKDNVLELTKKGAVNTRMVFEEGKEYLTDYFTPYGCLKLGLCTHTLDCTASEHQIAIRAEYTLSSEGEPVSDCQIEILTLPMAKARGFSVQRP